MTILWPDTPFNLQPSLVLVGRRGSEAHGTYIPPSDPNSIDDRDLMGICIPPPEYFLSLRQWEGADSIKGVWDVVLYDFRKFVNLLCKQNPNVLGMLWLKDEDYLTIGPAGMALIQNRMLFRARFPAYQSFMGYAKSQLDKMEANVFQGYMGAKRKALVEKYGYDCKNAAHLIRLLHMGEEYLRTGSLTVRRTWDRDLIIEVKRGGWKLADVQRYAKEYFEAMTDAYASSPLPEKVDYDKVNKLVYNCLRGHLFVHTYDETKAT